MNIKFWTILIIIVLALFLFTSTFAGLKQKLNDGSIIKFTSESHTSSNTEKTTEIIHDTETVYVRPNLCNVLAPYIIPSDIQNQCMLNGGTWRCDGEYAGCSNLPLPLIDCSGPAIYSSTYQCQQLGGTAVCDTRNAYCYYS